MMREMTTNAKVREGFEKAHQERGQAVRAVFRWISRRR